MEYRDYYATLGVPRTATQPEIKKAFRKAARKHHPDVNASDASAEGRFKEVNEAYDVLGDPEKRKLYDQLGANWESYQRAGATGGAGGARGFPGGQRAGAGGFPGGVRFETSGDPEDLAGFSDFFRAFFTGGSGGGPGGPARGDASAGSGRTAGGSARRRAGGTTIEDLFGGGAGAGGANGAAAGRGAGGASGRSGGTRQRQPGVEADLEIALEDVATGTTATVQIGDRRLEVKVPAGIEDGKKIRLTGKAGTGPDAGDLTLTIRVQPHPIFTRSGADVSRELAVNLGEALLGAEVHVGTLAGRTLLLTVPPGTQNGRSFRLRGHGLPRFKAEGHGDLMVRTRVVLPGALDEEGRRLATALVDHIAQSDPRSGRPFEPAMAARPDTSTAAAQPAQTTSTSTSAGQPG